MKQKYQEDDLLHLSGIQHFAFCERQWALIHLESQWVDNLRTVEGKLLHERADNPNLKECRGNIKTIRAVPLVSKSLGLYGIADVLEMHSDPEGDTGVFNLVEYKRGKPKPDDRDHVQLCAQAICLEEMLGIVLKEGYMYYGETKRRQEVFFDEKLRTRVRDLAAKMHELDIKGETPRVGKSAKCKNCSMIEVCLPGILKEDKKVEKYMAKLLKELAEE